MESFEFVSKSFKDVAESLKDILEDSSETVSFDIAESFENVAAESEVSEFSELPPRSKAKTYYVHMI